jgi:hypothetical protein
VNVQTAHTLRSSPFFVFSVLYAALLLTLRDKLILLLFKVKVAVYELSSYAFVLLVIKNA